MSVYVKSIKGQRDTNEDQHIIITNRSDKKPEYPLMDIFGVCDGHGGGTISKELSRLIPKVFMSKLSAPSFITFPLSKSSAMKSCDMIQKFLENRYPVESKDAGSTCLIVFRFDNIIDDKSKLVDKSKPVDKSKVIDKNKVIDTLNILNVGDSRAIICSGKIAKQITVDHKPLDPIEKQRIIKQGGKIYKDGLEWRVGQLSLTRAFGDITSQYTKPIPDVFTHKITKNDKFLILACDGLWDVIENQVVVNFVLHHCYDSETGKRINENMNIADLLTRYAIKLGSSDNITVIVIFL